MDDCLDEVDMLCDLSEALLASTDSSSQGAEAFLSGSDEVVGGLMESAGVGSREAAASWLQLAEGEKTRQRREQAQGWGVLRFAQRTTNDVSTSVAFFMCIFLTSTPTVGA